MRHPRAARRQPALATEQRAGLTALLLLCLSCGLPGSVSAAAPAAQAAASTLPAVVVWDFDNQSAGLATPADDADFLRRSLSESLTAALLQVAGLPVVERQRLKDVLAEQRLSSGELADEDARLRLGQIVGARRMVFGGFFVLGEDVQVHLRLIDTATSRVLFSDETTAPLGSVMQGLDALKGRLVQALGGRQAVLDARHNPPAKLWQAYDRALAMADAGRYEEAVQALQNLLAQDKDFTPAERQLVALLDKMARR
jgi:TolB-like protein